MSKVKKIIGVVLALVMALSCASVAFAAAGDAYTVSITAPATVNAGETATVEVKVTSNYPVSAMEIPVFFDKAKVEVVSASAAAVLDASSVEIAGQGTQTVVGKYYKESGLSADAYDVRSLVYVAGYGTDIQSYSNETVMTIEIKAKADASGDTLITFGNTMKTTKNQNGTLYVAKNSSEGVQVDSKGELIDAGTLEEATISISGSAVADPADLELTAAGAAAGVIIDKNKTFGGQYDGAVYGFAQPAANTFKNPNYVKTNVQATNGGSITVTTSNGKTTATGNYGTGSTITVLNSDGSTSKTYVVIIFGDVDGNGSITNADVSAIKTLSKDTTLADNALKRMAANTSGTTAKTLTMLTNADVLAAKYWSTKKQFTSTITIQKLAQSHKAASNYQ